MKPYRTTVLAAVLLVLAPSVTLPAMAQQGGLGFATMLAETGCESKYSDEKKADVFEAKYKNKEMTVSGEIADVSRGEIKIKILRSTITYDLSVTLSDPKSTYDLEKHQRVTLRFTVRRAGGCILPYSGDQGLLTP